MPPVTNTILRPDGTAATDARVVVELAGSGGARVDGLVAGHAIQGVFRPAVDATGTWTVTLTANSLITPAGTRWKAVEAVDGAATVRFLNVPNDSSSHFVGDILDTAPAAIADSALSAHETDVHAHPTVPSHLGFDVKAYGAKGDGATDDTAAIQAAIDAAAAAGGGAVFFPAGIYQVAGAQVSGTSNTFTYTGQLLFPARDISQSRITIRLVGVMQAPMMVWGPQVGDDEPVHTSGSIIRSTATSGHVFDVKSGVNPNASGHAYTNIEVEFENLTVRLPLRPTASALMLNGAASLKMDGCSVDVDGSAAGVGTTNPPSGTYGIVGPGVSNAAHVALKDTQVIGFDVGLSDSEHTTLDGFAAQLNNTGIQVNGAYHLQNWLRVLLSLNVRHINSSGGASYVVGSVDFESATSGWYATTATFLDPSDSIHGRLSYHHVTTNVGESDLIGNRPTGLALVRVSSDDTVARSSTVASSGSSVRVGNPYVYGVTDITLTAASVSIILPAIPTGRAPTFTLIVRQDATGGRLVTWTATGGVNWAGGSPPTLSTGAHAVDVFSFSCVAGVWFGSTVALNLSGAAPSTLILHAAADAGAWTDTAGTTAAAADGDKVLRWDDLGSFGNNLLTSATPAPTYQTNQVNGKPCVRFSGSQHIEETTSGTVAQPITAIVVLKQPAISSNENYIGNAGVSGNASFYTLAGPKAGVYGGSGVNGATPFSTTTPVIIASILNGASSKVWVNGGAADASGNAGALGLVSGIALGGYYANAPDFSGDIFEVYVYDAALSLSDINAVANALASKYALSWTTAT